ncbi:MAG: hypothetical protein IPL31_04250 [Saprospiraceae bacterium]|nr:hypothetical protein [Saprospiraceae bacterium]
MNEKQSRNVIQIILLISILLIIPLLHSKIEFSIDKLLPINDPDVAFFKAFQESFNTIIDDEMIFIGIENETGIFQKDFLLKTDSLTQFLSKLIHIQKVYSLTNSNTISLENGQFNAKPLIHISQPESYLEDSIYLFESEEFRNLLISKNGKSIAIAVFHSQKLNALEKNNLLQSIENRIHQLGFKKNTHCR